MISALIDSYLCRYLSMDEAQKVLECGDVKMYGRDSRLFGQGDPAGVLYVVLVGQVKVSAGKPGGPEKVLALLSGGDMVGEMSLVDTEPRSASAVTVSDTTVFELGRDKLMAFMRKEPSIAARLVWAMMETVCIRLRDTNKNYQDLLVRQNAMLRSTPRPQA